MPAPVGGDNLLLAVNFAQLADETSVVSAGRALPAGLRSKKKYSLVLRRNVATLPSLRGCQRPWIWSQRLSASPFL